MTLEDALAQIEYLTQLAQLLEIAHEYLDEADEPELFIARSAFLVSLYLGLSNSSLADMRLGIQGLVCKS